MQTNALAVANYFIKLAHKEGREIRPLGLMKLVYFAHGFSLALTNKSLLDSRFDKVEAWRYGPVIPSVYHTFKYLKGEPISEKDYALVMKGENDFEEAKLQDENAKRIVRIVYQRYSSLSDSELVSLTHREGTPWSAAYIPNANAPIPDEYTKLYYVRLIEKIQREANG